MSSSNGSRNNPYAQPPRPSMEESLKQLFRLQGLPRASAILPIIHQLSQQSNPIEWDLSLVYGVIQITLRCLESLVQDRVNYVEETTKQRPPASEGTLSMLVLLTVAMEEWSNECMYAALVKTLDESGSSQSTLLDHLVMLSTSGSDTVHRLGFVALSSAYKAMDRLDRSLTLDLSRPDAGWWLNSVTEDTIEKLCTIAVTILSSDESPSISLSSSFEPYLEQLRLAAASYLCVFLKRDQLCEYAFQNDQQIIDVLQHATIYMHMLIRQHPPMNQTPWCISLALASVSLVDLLRWRHAVDTKEYDNIVQSTGLADCLVTYLFSPTPLSRPPQQQFPSWILRDTKQSEIKLHAIDVLASWALTAGPSWAHFLGNQNDLKASVGDFWNNVCSNEHEKMISFMPQMVLLHTTNRLVARGGLLSLSENVASTKCNAKTILTTLLNLLQSESRDTTLYSVNLLRTLLSDRCSLSTHDYISRSFWGCIDACLLDQILISTLQISTSREDVRPLQLALIDLLDTLCQDQTSCVVLLESLSADRLEKIIMIVEPKKIKFDFQENTCWDDLSLDLDLNTPPANNLSRMDEMSACVEQEDPRVARGFDSTIHLACATLLARLGYCNTALPEEGVHLLKSRVRTVVNDFVADFFVSGEAPRFALSFDNSKRSLRLQVAMGSSENEDLLATSLFSAQLQRQKLSLEMHHNMQAMNSVRDVIEGKLKELEKQVKNLKARFWAQASVFHRETSKIKENASQDARQLVAIHVTERSNAEQSLAKMSHMLEEKETQLQCATSSAEESRRAKFAIEEELRLSKARTDEIQLENAKLKHEVGEEKELSKEMESERHSLIQRLDALSRSQKQLEDELEEQRLTIEGAESTNETLRENLEDLFTDMVSLCTVYEAQESEISTIRRHHRGELDKMQQDLQHEQERHVQLRRAHDVTQEANDKLWRKVEKYKQRLEDERRDREEDSIRRKRSGPVSYINQLHQSTSADQSRGRLSDKENTYSSSSSQRRKKY